MCQFFSYQLFYTNFYLFIFYFNQKLKFCPKIEAVKSKFSHNLHNLVEIISKQWTWGNPRNIRNFSCMNAHEISVGLISQSKWVISFSVILFSKYIYKYISEHLKIVKICKKVWKMSKNMSIFQNTKNRLQK